MAWRERAVTAISKALMAMAGRITGVLNMKGQRKIIISVGQWRGQLQALAGEITPKRGKSIKPICEIAMYGKVEKMYLAPLPPQRGDRAVVLSESMLRLTPLYLHAFLSAAYLTAFFTTPLHLHTTALFYLSHSAFFCSGTTSYGMVDAHRRGNHLRHNIALSAGVVSIVISRIVSSANVTLQALK